jgi:hypothetical protein
VGGEEQPDLFGLVIECARCAGVQVQRAKVVSLDT